MPLRLHIKARRGWDYDKEEFIDVPERDVELEHCLLAIARWESKWKIPFFRGTMTKEQWSDYIRFMALDSDEDEYFVPSLTQAQVKQVYDYIQTDQTATWFNKDLPEPPKTGEETTSELVYYYMAQVPLPFDICERWHLSRLLTTLKIASIKSNPEGIKKMSQSQIAEQNRALNEARHKACAKANAKAKVKR